MSSRSNKLFFSRIFVLMWKQSERPRQDYSESSSDLLSELLNSAQNQPQGLYTPSQHQSQLDDNHISSSSHMFLFAQDEDRLPPFQYQIGDANELIFFEPVIPTSTGVNNEDNTKGVQKSSKQTYSEQTRREKIERYLRKKRNRHWNKQIFYRCRKELADRRERVSGRFVKKSPLPHPLTPVTTKLKSFELQNSGLEHYQLQVVLNPMNC